MLPIIPVSSSSPIGARQPNSSAETAEFRENVISDIKNMAERINYNTAEQQQQVNALSNDMRYARAQLDNLRATNKSEMKLGSSVVMNLNLNATEGVRFAEGTNDGNKCRLATNTGKVSLPVTSIKPVFYRTNPVSGSIFLHDSFDATIQSIKEPGFPTVTSGDIKSAFSGSDRSFWMRRIEYPIDANVQEVSSELLIKVSASESGGKLNRLAFRPFPLGTMDITGIWIKANNSSPFQLLPEFPHVRTGSIINPIAQESIDEIDFNFQDKSFVEIKIGLRQKNSIVEGNRKVFYYGFEEIMGELVSYTRSNSNYNSDLKLNNHIAWEIEAPEGRNFNSITFFDSDPNIQGERQGDINQAHLIYYIAESLDISDPGTIYWNSFDFSSPQSGVTIEINAAKFYMIAVMKYVGDSILSTSPFKSGTTPVISRLALRMGLETLDVGGDPGFVLPAGFWDVRNDTTHYMNETLFDSVGGVLTQEQPALALWDDFWGNDMWRAAHRGDPAVNVVEDKDNMRLITTTSTANGQGEYYTKPVDMNLAPINGEWFPTKFRVHFAGSTEENSSISFYLVANTDIGNEEFLITPFEWLSLPAASVKASSFSLKIVFQNSSSGLKPFLKNYLIVAKA